VFYQGKVCGHVRKYSDALLLALVRSREPSFRDNAKLEVNSGLDIVAILSGRAAAAKARREAEADPAGEA
jgi:hypothetical protein